MPVAPSARGAQALLQAVGQPVGQRPKEHHQARLVHSPPPEVRQEEAGGVEPVDHHDLAVPEDPDPGLGTGVWLSHRAADGHRQEEDGQCHEDSSPGRSPIHQGAERYGSH